MLSETPSGKMTTYLFHSSSYGAAISILLLIAPITAWGGVSFPKNPQTTAECEGPIEEMRAMANSEHELASQLKWPVAPEGCFYNSRCANAYHDEHAKIADEKGMHYKKRDRIYKELSDLKQTCYATARANEKLADEAKQKERLAEEARLAEAKRAEEARQNEKLDNEARQREAASLLDSKPGRDVKEAYENVKEAKESDGTIPGFLENGLNKTKDQFVKEGVDNAYVKRNDAHSDSLENAMDTAKESILDPVPKSPIIGAIQDASFDRLKSHVQQLSGDMTALESAINSVDSGTSSASQEAAPVALPRRGSSSGSTMFQQAISQAEQDAKDPSARVARERRAAEQEKIESEQAAKAQEQSSQAAWDVLGKLGKAAIAAAGGQSSAEQMQLALNSLAQGEEETSTSGSASADGAVRQAGAGACHNVASSITTKGIKKNRTLRAPKGFEMLQPTDVFVDFGLHWCENKWKVGDIDYRVMGISSGRDFEEARQNRSLFHGTGMMSGEAKLKASDLTGKIGLGWVAWVYVSDWQGYQDGKLDITAGAAFVAGGATLDEALAEGFKNALMEYRKHTNKPIRHFTISAGVSAKLDVELYKKLGTFSNVTALPFFFLCETPYINAEAQEYGFTSIVPESPEEFVRYIRALKSKEYYSSDRNRRGSTKWFGCGGFSNNPVSLNAEPVFVE